MSETITGFGPQIKARREALGFTLRDVEAITNGEVSNSYLSQLENGKIKSPSAHIVIQLCEAYAVSHDDMLAWLGTPARIVPPRICNSCGQALPRNAPLQEGVDYEIDSPTPEPTDPAAPPDLSEHFPTGLRSRLGYVNVTRETFEGPIQCECWCGASFAGSDEQEVRELWAEHVATLQTVGKSA